MKARDYKIRIAVKPAEATSENVALWIDEALKNGGALRADPGAGDQMIALRLDTANLMELANKKNERVHVLLRRLIATRCDLPPAEKEEHSAGAVAAAALPDPVLPAKLRYTAEDFIDFVRGMDKSLAMLYRKGYGVKELTAVDTAEEDRNLAEKMAEAANRRAPKWMIENADLLKLTFALVRWTNAQTDELDRQVTEHRSRRPAPGSPILLKPVKPESPENAEPQPPEETAAVNVAMSDEPVQQEGQF